MIGVALLLAARAVEVRSALPRHIGNGGPSCERLTAVKFGVAVAFLLMMSVPASSVSALSCVAVGYRTPEELIDYAAVSGVDLAIVEAIWHETLPPSRWVDDYYNVMGEARVLAVFGSIGAQPTMPIITETSWNEPLPIEVRMLTPVHSVAAEGRTLWSAPNPCLHGFVIGDDSEVDRLVAHGKTVGEARTMSEPEPSPTTSLGATPSADLDVSGSAPIGVVVLSLSVVLALGVSGWVHLRRRRER